MSSIQECVKENDVTFLKFRISPGMCSQKDLDLGLMQAAKLGFVDCVKCLLEAGADINYTNMSCYTPLLTAVKFNKVSVVRLLLENKADPNFRSGLNMTSLLIAAQWGYSDIVDLLLKYRASILSRDVEGNTALILSSRNGHYMAMRSLLDAGCDVNATNNEGCTSLHYACHKARGYQMLLDAGANPDIADKDSVTPLLMAASEGFDKVVKALVEAKCNVNIPNESVKRTALHILSFKGHTESIDYLVYGGANIDACDTYNRSPLWYAIQNKKVNVVRLLLKAYSHVDTFQCPGKSSEDCPAKLAFEQKQFDIIKFFLLTGYDHDHVRECILADEHSDWLKSNPEYEHWLEFGSSAQTLKQLCRKWIRHYLGRQFYHHLQFLSIPEVMKNYLFLEELHDH
ncbi:hypothetical protein ACF0H5_007586 [Mactra antiquata]